MDTRTEYGALEWSLTRDDAEGYVLRFYIDHVLYLYHMRDDDVYRAEPSTDERFAVRLVKGQAYPHNEFLIKTLLKDQLEEVAS